MLPDHIVLYDGVCGLCGWAVRWLLAHDPAGRLFFASLQGKTAATLGVGWDEEAPPTEASVVYVDTTVEPVRVVRRSRAVAEALRVSGAWPAARAVIRITPRPLADAVYRFIARIRYRIWGRHDECRIPAPDERARFLA